jgi:hypothetical protein
VIELSLLTFPMMFLMTTLLILGVGIFHPNFSNVMGKCKPKFSIAILYTHPINSRKKKREIATEKPDKNKIPP